MRSKARKRIETISNASGFPTSEHFQIANLDTFIKERQGLELDCNLSPNSKPYAFQLYSNALQTKLQSRRRNAH